MTQAEKMAEDFMDNCDVGERPGEDEIVQLIHQVAERTRKDFALRCRNKFGYAIGYIVQSVVDDEAFRWEDEEVLDKKQ